MSKIFYRVHVVLNDKEPDERESFSFDFQDRIKASTFADWAFKSECAYDRVYTEVLEYDPFDMTSVDAPCWRYFEE